MKNHSKSTKAKSLTPSTLKLNQMVAGRKLGMLTQEKIELMGIQQKSSIKGFIGMFAGKTKKIASLKEIKKAIAEGWGNG